MTKNHNTIWLWVPKFIHVIIEQNSVFYSKVEVAQRISSAFLHHGSNLQIRWTDISNSRIQAQRAWFLVIHMSIFTNMIFEHNSNFWSKVEVAQRISSAFLHHVHFYSSQVTTKEWKMIICFPSYFMAITTWREGASTYSSYPPRNTFSTLYDEVHSLRLWSFKKVLHYHLNSWYYLVFIYRCSCNYIHTLIMTAHQYYLHSQFLCLKLTLNCDCELIIMVIKDFLGFFCPFT